MDKKDNLTRQQLAVLEAEADIKRVIACAGSGKTRVITQGIIDVLQKGLCEPYQVLALTFTRNAAENMRARIREILGSHQPDQIDIYTFNSLGHQIIGENSLQLGLGKDFRVLSSAESWQMIYDIFRRHVFEHLDIGKLPGKTVQEILSYIDSLKNNLVSPGDLKAYLDNHDAYLKDYASKALFKQEKQSIRLQGELCLIYQNYEEQKIDQNCIDYQDQVFLPYHLLKNQSHIREKYANQYQYIFVDEFQDTNIAQAYLLALLNGSGTRMMVVGDDDQGIYAFRGACVENILHFHHWDQFAQSNVSDFYLTTNFRSGAEIIDVLNKVISPNQNRFDKRLNAAKESPVSKAVFFHKPTHVQEAEKIAAIIQDLRRQGVKLKDMAILLRKKKFGLLAGKLQAQGLPYEIVGSKNFYYEKEILFILSWLYVAADLYDEKNLIYLLQSEKYKIGDRDLFFLKREHQSGKPVKLIEGIQNCKNNPYLGEETQKRLGAFLAELKYYISRSYSLRLKELVSLIYQYSGLRDELKSCFDAAGKKKIKNVETLIKIASDFEDHFRESGLDGFHTYLREVAKTDFEGSESLELSSEDSVKVMSIHAAKGLEFAVIFLPMLWENDYLGRSESQRYGLPAQLRKDHKIWARKKEYKSKKAFKDDLKQVKIEEERRIFYVACSRAKKLLVLSHSDYLNDYHRIQDASKKNILHFVQDAIHSKDLNILDRESLEYIQSLGWDGKQDHLAGAQFYQFLKGKQRKSIPRIDWDAANKMLLKHAAKIRAKHIGQGLSAPKPLPKTSQAVFPLTAVLTYMQCPALYQWKYRNRVPQKSSQTMNMGEQIHSLIEKATRIKLANHDLQPRMLLETIQQKSLRPYMQRYMQSGLFNLSALEKIWLEQLIYHKIEPYVIASKIDRLQHCGSRYRIIDYKFSKKPTKDNPTYIQQLKGYILACADAFACSSSLFDAQLFYLKDGSFSKYNFSKQDLEEFKNDLLSAISHINAQKFGPKKGPSCTYCAYRDFCQA